MFTIDTVTDLQWCDAEHTFFECRVKYEEFDEVMWNILYGYLIRIGIIQKI